MNKTRNVPAEFGPEVRFEVAPDVSLSFREGRERAFEQLKDRLLASRLDEVWEAGENLLVRRAANEAAALAWRTPYPVLVFPLLFEETVEEARNRKPGATAARSCSRELLRA